MNAATPLPSWVRFTCLALSSALLLVPHAVAAPPPGSDALPVLLRGGGNWLDRAGATQRINVILPVEGKPLVLTNLWMQGARALASEELFGSGVLLLSNVWTYGSTNLPEEVFWRAQGLSNAPLELAIPGGSGYYLPIANSRVLPFLGRRGTTAPAAIWSWPMLPVMFNGIPRGSADISKCAFVSFGGETVNLSGRLGSFSLGQNWRLSASGGLVRLQLEIWLEPDW